MQNIFRDVHERAASDRRKDRVGFRRDDFAVVRDEQNIGAARLFDKRMRGGIEVDVFGESVFVRVDDIVQTHRVIDTRFDIARSAGSCAVGIGNAYGDRFDAAFKIRADGSDEDAELVFVGGLYADDGIRTEHIGTDVQRRTASVGRHVGFIRFYDGENGFDEFFFRKYGHFEPLARTLHALTV